MKVKFSEQEIVLVASQDFCITHVKVKSQLLHLCILSHIWTHEKVDSVHLQHYLLVHVSKSVLAALEVSLGRALERHLHVSAALSHCGLTHQQNEEPPRDRQADEPKFIKTSVRKLRLLASDPKCFLFSCGQELLTVFHSDAQPSIGCCEKTCVCPKQSWSDRSSIPTFKETVPLTPLCFIWHLLS